VRLAVIILALFVASACRKPDLTIDSGRLKVDLAGTGVPGGSLRLASWRMINRGTARARSTHGAISSSYHLSTDPVVTMSDRVLRGSTSVEVDDIGPGESHEFPGDQQIAIPEDVAPGTYYFGVIVDDNNGVEESDETNNVSIVRIGVVKAQED
jgi:hypothetical protein